MAGMISNDDFGGSSAGLSSEQKKVASENSIVLFKALGAYVGWALVVGLPLYFGTDSVVAGIVGAVVGLAISIVFKVVPFFKKHKPLQLLLLWLPWVVVAIVVVIKIATN